MAVFNTESFWQDFMRRPEAQKAYRMEQKQALQEQTEELHQRYLVEQAELRNAIRESGEAIQRLVAPILQFHMVHRLLYGLLQDCKDRGTDFVENLKEGSRIRSYLQMIADEYKANPENVKSIEEKWTDICIQHQREEGKDIEIDMTPKTWKDLPVEELAERLSKGEVINRDEWIPGVSEGKKKLDAHSLKEHLTFGESIRREGNREYESKNYEMALTRYTQGVQLLNWVEATNEEDNRAVEELFLIHLKNQAQAALRIGRWNEAIKASKEAIQIDMHDAKAWYCLGQAQTMIGQLDAACNSYAVILKSLYSNEASQASAKRRLLEIQQMREKHKSRTRGMIEKSVKKGLFTENRPEISRADASNDVNTDYEEEDPEAELNRGLMNSSFGKSSQTGTAPEAVDSSSDLAHPVTRSWNIDRRRAEDHKTKQNPSVVNALGSTQSPSAEGDEWSPEISVAKCQDMLNELLQAYNTPEFQQQLFQIRRDADFDERRIIIRTRKILGAVQDPILLKYGFLAEKYEDRKKAMDRAVAYWRSRDSQVAGQSRDILSTIFGDCCDIE